MVKSGLSRYVSCFVFIAFLFCGCTRNTTSSSENSPEPTLVIPSEHGTPTERTTVSSTTPSIQPNFPTSTISPTEKAMIISHLLTNDYLCDLPCWGGIEPGVTTELDAIEYINHIAIYSPTHHSAEIIFQDKKYFIGIHSSNSTVDFLLVPRLDYSLTQLLQKYGKPDGIFLYILDSLPIETNNPYSLFLFYKDQGILVEYNGKSPKGEFLSLCLLDESHDSDLSLALSLWRRGSDYDFQEVLSKYVDQYFFYSELKYYSLTELSDNSIEGFYEVFSDYETNNECLSVKNPNGPP